MHEDEEDIEDEKEDWDEQEEEDEDFLQDHNGGGSLDDGWNRIDQQRQQQRQHQLDRPTIQRDRLFRTCR